VSYRVIVDLMRHHHRDRLTVRWELDPAFYPKGITVSDDEMAAFETCAMNSTESGTIRSVQATIQIGRLIPDGPSGLWNDRRLIFTIRV
jgi:hypothetical protein